VTSAYLDRFVDEQRVLASTEHASESDERMPYLRYMSQTGRRVAEMHLALAGQRRIRRFRAGATGPEDVQRWIEDVVVRAERVCDASSSGAMRSREADRPLVEQLLAQRDALRGRLNALLPPDIDGLKIRHHGDFHLGQMLIVKDDIFIIDFEGEPRRPHAERRRKAPAARECRRPDPFDRLFATAALGARAEGCPDEQGKLGAALGEWRDRATAAFLAAYREIMTDARCGRRIRPLRKSC